MYILLIFYLILIDRLAALSYTNTVTKSYDKIKVKEIFMRKSVLRGISLSAAIMLAISTTAYAETPSDGQTNAEKFAANAGLTSQWENWKTAWETEKNDWTDVSITPGSDETELNFAWYSKTQNVNFVVNSDLDTTGSGADGSYYVFGYSEEIKGVADEELVQDGVQYYACKTTVTDLKPGVYTYQIDDNEPVSFTVQDPSEGFSFIFVGDPQVGSSNSMKGSKVTDEESAAAFYASQSDAVRSDAFNWSNTLNAALKTSSDASFVLSAGDQVQCRKKDAPANKTDNTYSEIEYAGFLSADALKSLPLAPTVGNHDSTLVNYTYHFNTPNNSELGSNGIVGGDYWFTYGNALFLMLNTQDTNTAEHRQFIEQAVEANPDCKWRFVTMHQDIYGSAEHSNEPEITNLRYELVPYFEEFDIDVVFTGHDHAYSRSYILNGGNKSNTYYDDNEDEYDEMFEFDIDGASDDSTVYTAYGMIESDTTDSKQKAYLDYLTAIEDKNAIDNTTAKIANNPEGILYMTANSSSGSKYYDLTSRMQSYVANRWQEDVPTYSVVELTDTTFTINTYRTDTNEKIDTEFKIVKDSATNTEDNSGEDGDKTNPDTGNSSVAATFGLLGTAAALVLIGTKKIKH